MVLQPGNRRRRWAARVACGSGRGWRRVACLAVAMLVLTTAAPRAAHATSYELSYVVTNLGFLPGYASYSEATAINDSGQVVGSSWSSGYARAFRYSGGVMTDLGGPSGYEGAEAYDIDASGHVAATVAIPGYIARAAEYDGSWHTLAKLTGAGDYYWAYGSNDNGLSVGLQRWDNGGGSYSWLPVEYNANTHTTLSLGSLGSDNGQANAVNNSNVAVGHSVNASGKSRAFRYTDGGGMTDLNVGDGSVAWDINNDGDIVGSGYNGYAWLRTSAGLVTSLGALGGTSSEAYAVNSSDWVVGMARTADNAQHAFVYRNGTMTDLNSLLPAGTGWTLTVASDINTSGQIVGYGTYGGVRTAFLLNPVLTELPEPSSASLLLLGGVLGWVSRRRRRR